MRKRSSLLLKKSTRRFFQEARQTSGYRLTNWIHGYIYGRWIYLYIAIGTGEHPLAKVICPLVAAIQRFAALMGQNKNNKNEITFADTYHGKVVSLDGAKQLVSINRPIRLPDLEQVIPYRRARDIILKNPDHIVVLDCPCRASRANPCTPLDVCLIIGEPFAAFVLEHHPGRSRAIEREEALEILTAEHKRGHVHHAFFKEAMLNRFYAICNCCGCCCGAIQAWRHGTPMLAGSGYISRVDPEKCIHCGQCVPYCQFDALSREEDSIVLDGERCLGCGVCVTHCNRKARFLEADPEKGTPLEIQCLINAMDKE